MPKIPTFIAETRMTTNVADIKTEYQAPLTGGPVASLVPAIQKLNEYYVAQQDLTEKIEAEKETFIIKGEADKFLKQEENNFNEQNAIQNFTNKWNNLTKQKLDGVSNIGVRNRMKQNLDLEYGDYIYNIKKQSFTALETESINTYNSRQNILAAKYQTYKDNPIIKEQIKSQMLNNASDFAKSMQLSPINEINKKNAIERDLLFLDFGQLVGLENGAELIKNLDDSLKNQTLLSDEDFGKGIFNVYNQKIFNLTVKGNPDSDYDRALELVKQLETFERSNGYKVNSGDLSIKINSLKEDLIDEQIQHEDLLLKVGNNKLFFEYSNDLVKGLTTSITDKGLGLPAEFSDEIAAAEIESEYKQRIKNYLFTNADASLAEKKQFAKELTYTLKNIYDDKNIIKNQNRILDENKFNIEEEHQKIINDIKLLIEGNLDPDLLDQYKFRAIQQGFFKIIKDKDGKEKKEGDVISFINEYLPILESQIQQTILGK